MSTSDRFGGAQAYDDYTTTQDARLEAIRKANPGCGTCLWFIESDYDPGHGYCSCGLSERMGRWKEELSKFEPRADVVSAKPVPNIEVPCEYEDWTEG